MKYIERLKEETETWNQSIGLLEMFRVLQGHLVNIQDGHVKSEIGQAIKLLKRIKNNVNEIKGW